MEFKKIVAPSLTDLFVEQITEMIFSGTLRAGDKLPPERKMADDMNVSIAVINGGINRLVQMKLLKSESRKGVFVADYIQDGDINTMMMLMEYRKMPLDNELISMMEYMRKAIEIQSVKHACKNRTADNLANLKKIYNEMKSIENKASEKYVNLMFDFHHEVAIASGYMYYPMMLRSYEPIYKFFFRNYQLKPDRWSIIEIPFENIISAIESRNAEEGARQIEVCIAEWKTMVTA